MDELQAVFEMFASFGTGPSKCMDNAHFAKMLKEAKIMDSKTFTSIDADILFNRAKPRGDRRISFDVFRDAVIPEIAAKKKTTPQEIALILISTTPYVSR